MLLNKYDLIRFLVFAILSVTVYNSIGNNSYDQAMADQAVIDYTQGR